MERLAAIARLRVDPLVITALTLLPLLSALDFCLTVRILEAGGRELNPLFADLLVTSPADAFWVKMLLTVGGTAMLAVTSHLKAARCAIFALLGIYSALVVYEVGLLRLVI